MFSENMSVGEVKMEWDLKEAEIIQLDLDRQRDKERC